MTSNPPRASATRGRRGARRLAVQAVYQWLIAGGESSALIAEFLRDRATPGVDQSYFHALVTVCLDGRPELDALLVPELSCSVEQVDPVEHAILLVGAAELRDRLELSVSVVINEAVELAKAFGADNGHRFVNAVLDKLASVLRPDERKGLRRG